MGTILYLQCVSFSFHCLLLLLSVGSKGAKASVVVTRGLSSYSVWALECAGFCHCGAWAKLLCGMWNLPKPGIKPVSFTLTGGFLSTEPSGKSLTLSFAEQKFLILMKSSLPIISFRDYIFGVKSKNLLPH